MVFLKLIAHVETRWRKQWSGAGGGGGGGSGEHGKMRIQYIQ